MRLRRVHLVSYAGGLAAVAVAYAIVIWTWPFFLPVPFMLFYPAVAASAWIGGAGPGLVAILASALLWRYPLIPAAGVPGAEGGAGVARLALFMLVCLCIVWLVASLRRARRIVAEHDQSLRLALDAGQTGVWDWNIPQDRITWSERVYEFHGIPPGQFGGRVADFQKLIHPGDAARVHAAIGRAIENREPYDIEFRVRRPSGEVRWIYTSGRVLYDEAGRPVRMLGATRDVTGERRAQERVRESDARFRTTADSAPVLIWICGPDGRYTWFNRPWLEFGARSLDSSAGLEWGAFCHRDDQDAGVHAFAAGFDARQPFTAEYRLRRHDGEWRWVVDNGTLLESPDGEFAGYIGSCIDIHDRKCAEQERAQLLAREREVRGQLEHANRMKDEFLATLSHELRTPLQAILGWSRVIRSGGLDAAETAEAVEIIERSAGQQAQLIEDLLDMSRITSGKIQLDVQRVEMAAVIEAALGTVRPAVEAKQICVRQVLDPLAGPVAGDPRRLQQVLWNLLSNAIKFTPKGGTIEIVLQRVNSHVEVHVSDTGQGIEPLFLAHVFDRFRQADASAARRHEGLGIGLAIVRQLVELHGGTVSARSEGAGKGAVFSVALPRIVVHAGRPEPGCEHPQAGTPATPGGRDVILEGVRVVVVDDNDDTLEMLRRVLQGRGAAVETARSGPEAFTIVERHPPDVMVSDIGMPGLDGYELIRRIRAQPGPSAGVPAIALTAFARSEDRTRAMLAGYQMHLSKPVEPAELIAAVASIAGRDGRPPAAGGAT